MKFAFAETLATEPFLMGFEVLMCLTIIGSVVWAAGKTSVALERRSLYITLGGKLALLVPGLVIGSRTIKDAAHYFQYGAATRHPLAMLSSWDIVTLGTPVVTGVAIYGLASVLAFWLQLSSKK